jgi:hypothetical protein
VGGVSATHRGFEPRAPGRAAVENVLRSNGPRRDVARRCGRAGSVPSALSGRAGRERLFFSSARRYALPHEPASRLNRHASRQQESAPRHRTVGGDPDRLELLLRHAAGRPTAAGTGSKPDGGYAGRGAGPEPRAQGGRPLGSEPRDAAGGQQRGAFGREPRGGARPLAADPDRYAPALRLDRAQGRPRRRRVAEDLPRDGGPEEPADRAALAVRQRQPVLRRVRLGRDRQRSQCRHAMDGRQRRSLAGQAGDADLGQRRGPRLPASDRRRREDDAHHRRRGGEPGQRPRHALPVRSRVAARQARHAGLLRPARRLDRRARRPGSRRIQVRIARQGAAGSRPEHAWARLERRDGRLPRDHRQVLGRGRHPGPEPALSGQLHLARGRADPYLPGQHAGRRQDGSAWRDCRMPTRTRSASRNSTC